MRHATGAALVLIGLAPVAGLLWVWSLHMYTVGFSADTWGVIVLSLLAVADLACLSGGAYLLFSPKFSN